MLDKPDLPEESLVSALYDAYGLPIAQIAFLPLGADRHTAVYRALAGSGTAYFVKLRSGVFDEASVTLRRFLSDQGIAHIIAPLATKTGHLWTDLDAFKLILYPFVEGDDGYEFDLLDRQWRDLGQALQRIHTTKLPRTLGNRIQRETYSSQWRESAQSFLARRDDLCPGDPVAAELVAVLKTRHAQIRDLIGRAERLAQQLQARSGDLVLCHTDIHGGNVLIDPTGALYIVDWDNPTFAPKERDLMAAGGGLFGNRHTAQEEEFLFYQGYGPTDIDPAALAYYRYERIVEDIAVICEHILSTDEGSEDRPQVLRYLESNFLPNGTIEIAYASDKTWPGSSTTSGNTSRGFVPS